VPRLIVVEAGILEQVAQAEEKLRLHAADYLGEVVGRRAGGDQPLQGLPDSGKRPERPPLGFRQVPADPARIAVGHHLRPGLLQKEEAVKLVESLSHLRFRPAPRLGCPQPGKQRREFRDLVRHACPPASRTPGAR
jgi:hypothetical protein